MSFRRVFYRGLMAFAAVALVAPKPAAAYTYLEAAYGTQMIGLSAKAISMGGAVTALADGSFSLVQNPAMMSHENNRMADLTLRGIRYDETRFVPLFDTFDSIVRETAVAENPRTYTGINGGFVWQPEKNPHGFALGAGVFERYNLQFDFVDERRNGDGFDVDGRDKVMATQTIKSERAIYSASAGVSYQEKVLSVGASVHYLFGDLQYSNATVPGPESRGSVDGPSRTELDRDVSGVGATFGVAANISDRVTAGLSFDIPVKLDVDYRMSTLTSTIDETTIGSETIDYPGRLAVGIAYRPRNVLATTFSLDVSRTFWQDLEDPIFEMHPLIVLPDIRNTYDFRFGLEHIFYNGLPARFGFFYKEAYAADEVDTAGLSFGTGFKHKNFDIGLGADVSKRNSRQSAITPRDSNDPDVERVQDSILRGVLDVRYHF